MELKWCDILTGALFTKINVNHNMALWRHQMETFSVLLAICAGNSPVSGEFPAQRPVTRSFDVFFDLCPNKRLIKHSWGGWFETPSGSLWRHSNGLLITSIVKRGITSTMQPLNFKKGCVIPWNTYCVSDYLSILEFKFEGILYEFQGFLQVVYQVGKKRVSCVGDIL